MKTTSYPYTYFKGKITPSNKAVVNIQTNALQYGTGIFAGIRGYYQKKTNQISLFRLKDHYQRFLNSHQVLHVKPTHDLQELIDITVQLTKKTKPQTNTYYRPFGYAGSHQIAPNLAKTSKFSFSLHMIPLGDYLATNHGIKTCVSSWSRISDSAIPVRAKISGAYINSALAKQEATLNGFDEAIMLNQQGHVSEGTAMNFFMVRHGQLITTPITEEILEGITRKTILEIAKDHNIPTQIRQIDRSELYLADEAFFAGTGAQISPIKSIDHRILGTGDIGKITQTIQTIYFNIVNNKNPKYKHHLTTIKL